VCWLDSFDLVQGRGEDFYGLKTICVWWTVVDTMMNIWVPLNAGNSRPAEQLLASKEIICPYFPSPGPPLDGDQPDTQTSTWQHTTLTKTVVHTLDGIRTRNPSKRAPADAHSRPRGHWDCRNCKCRNLVSNILPFIVLSVFTCFEKRRVAISRDASKAAAAHII